MDKRKFLYYNLSKIENNKRIIILNYIESNKIDHSENLNGLLLNLSQLDEKHIDFFYDLYNLENKYSYHKNVEIKPTQKKESIMKVKYKEYQLNPLEKLILSYSF